MLGTVLCVDTFSSGFGIDSLDYCFCTFMNLEAPLLSLACLICEDFLTINMKIFVSSA